VTLCIAWQDSEGLHMASDSRISSGGRYIDTGVKVFAVPVTIFPARFQGKPEPSPLYRQVLGLCAAGSLISIYNVIEILRDILQALYLTPWMSSASMDDLCNIVSMFFENISRRVCEALAGDAGAASLVLAGFCHEQNRFRVFRMNLDTSAFPITLIQTELDLSAHLVECFGSGAPAAQRIFAATPSRHPLHVLKDVILDHAEPTVGGCLQFGEFKEKDFQTLGVEDYFIHSERQIEVGFFLRGVKVFDSLQNLRNVTPRMLVVQPFTTQIDALLDQGYIPRQ
jgi:hypothetical protein